MPIQRAVVTGASGFVGSALLRQLPAEVAKLSLAADDWRQRIAATSWRGATVFHLAAHVHRRGAGDEAGYQRDNVDKTRALAEAAARGGARRLVFASSIKVNGEGTAGRPFTAADAPRPQDAYGRSKLAAERMLQGLAGKEALEVVVLRLPLVYGPGARGNLAAFLRLCDTPWPLPFGALRNRRSFVDVEDVAALLVHAAAHGNAAGRTFLVAHPDPVSTARLAETVRSALGRPRRLLPVPPAWLRAAARLTGTSHAMERLTGDLEIDASDLERDLGWRAGIGLEASVGAMVAAYSRDAR